MVVETATAERIRLEGIRVLEVRYRELAGRMKRRMPTSIERADLSRMEASLEALNAMQPAANLLPARSIGQWV